MTQPPTSAVPVRLDPPTQMVREVRTVDAIDAVEAILGGDWSLTDAAALVGERELAEGLLYYAEMLEAYLLIKAGADPASVRSSARVTAAAWRNRSTGGA